MSEKEFGGFPYMTIYRSSSAETNEYAYALCVYIGFVTSIFSIGGLLGAISAGPISDRYGRKNALLFNCIFFIIGPAFEALAQSQWTLAFGRILSGFGSGSSLVVAPIYVHDIAPSEYAGFL